MKDPYHNARLRFKVARDRFTDGLITRSAQWKRCAGRPFPCDNSEEQRRIQDCFTLRELVELGNRGCVDDVVEAACILHTMQRYKLTDERQALMLWKLSRD